MEQVNDTIAPPAAAGFCAFCLRNACCRGPRKFLTAFGTAFAAQVEVRRSDLIILARRFYRSLVLPCFLLLTSCSEGTIGTEPTDPQPAPPALPSGRGNFRHIDILAFTRGLNYNVPAGAERQSVEEWLAYHVDINESDSGIKGINPHVRVFRYDLDLTIALPPNSPLPATEDAFLHFAEQTTIQPRDLAGNDIGDPIVIPGCPAGQPLSADSRIRVHMWESDRLVFNPASEEFRTWQSSRLLSRMGDQYDGVFLDEHSPGFKWGLYLRQNRILAGGAVRELGGLRPGDQDIPGKNYNELDRQYSTVVADWLAYLRSKLQAEGKFILINPAQYYWVDLSENEYTAAGGATLEFVHVPFDWSATLYARFAERIQRAVNSGVMIDLFGRWCVTGPSHYTPGNYVNKAARYRMWRLASYYYVRGYPDSPGIVYFNPSFCNENSSLADYLQEWAPAYEFDIGDPLGEGFVLQEGQAGCGSPYQIFARQYTFGLVLVRPQDDWDCRTFDDTSAAAVPLSPPMRLLQADGTLSQPLSSILIRNAEAAILIDASLN
jgi:hypothetical protein